MRIFVMAHYATGNGEMSVTWNPWHGCHKISEGCRHCYVYRQDALWDKQSSAVTRTAQFDLPVRRNRKGLYKIPSGEFVYTCFTSDFFVEEADVWRPQAWAMIRLRRDLTFLIITKRIDRFRTGLPDDWGDGYDNVIICSTCETQERADYRLPIFLEMPIRHRQIVCEPLLEAIDLKPYLTHEIESVYAGGESGVEARPCDYTWILSLRDQCRTAGIGFRFHQTGARLIKDGRLYRIPRRLQHEQARKAEIDIP